MAYSFQGNHTGQLDFCNWLAFQCNGIIWLADPLWLVFLFTAQRMSEFFSSTYLQKFAIFIWVWGSGVLLAWFFLEILSLTRKVIHHSITEDYVWLALAQVGDFKIGGRIINKVRFVDDTAIVAKTQEELQDIVNRLVDTGRKSTLTNHK